MKRTTNDASHTAEYMALFRALETAKPLNERLFTDRFARCFLSRWLCFATGLARFPLARRLVSAYVDCRQPGAQSSGIARTRLIDDAITEALRSDTRQLVTLGSGFDCRAYWILGLRHIRVFEVDLPGTLARKRECLRQALGTIPSDITFVEIDFNHQALADVLSEAGMIGPSAQFSFGRASQIIYPRQPWIP